MRVISAKEAVHADVKNGVVAIGNFDGVHRGHQTLLDEARKLAKEKGLPFGIVTFEPHPRSFFKPDEPVFRLTPHPLKARLLAALGADFMAVLSFDGELSNLQPEDFVRHHLVERLGVAHVVTGYDFHFGRGRRGSPQSMQAYGKEMGFGVSIIDQVTDEGDMHSPFSSSGIRQALRRGHVAAAARDLGYHWMVMGEVVKGDQRGRTIGFPTLNIQLEPGAEPSRGIYAVRVRDALAPQTMWLGAGYFGNRPTFDTDRTFLEVFLIDFTGDLYGRTLIVEFIDQIRPDRRFDSVEELKAQMRKDCDDAVLRLKELEGRDPIALFPLGRLQEEGRL